MKRNKIKIGLFGFGCVGSGLHDVLEKTPGLKAEIVKICVKNRNKLRQINNEYFTFYKNELLHNPEINVIVELIDDSEAAFDIVSTALKNKKAVVTANKKMVSEHLEELLQLQTENKTPVLYEAACCASIPIIRNLEEYYDNDLLQSFTGIMNGTTNYMLTEIFSNKSSYEEALNSAQQKGYAESNPKLDVEGYDSKYKLNILLAHAFGLVVKPEKIFNVGIQKINKFDSLFASSRNSKIKLLAHAKKLSSGNVAAFVLPELIHEQSELYSVDGVYNGIVTESSFSDKNIFIGKGAGAYPTASAVLSDISALSYDYKYEYKKKYQDEKLLLEDNFFLDIYVRFNSKQEIDLNDFSEIYEHYKSNGINYVTGKINFKSFSNSAWVTDPEVSVISLGNLKEPQAQFMYEEETKVGAVA